MHLLVDLGNSAIKVAPVRQSLLETASTEPTWQLGPDRPWPEQLRDTALHWHCVSVNGSKLDWLQQQIAHHGCGEFVEVLDGDRIGMQLEVEFPEQVGVDRIAAANAARLLKANDHAAIVIDLGTATTVDAVSVSGSFLGGAILASPRLNLDALHQATERLPQLTLETNQSVPVVGRNTQAAMLSGAFWGQVGAIEWLRTAYQTQLDVPCETFLCGGGHTALARQLAPPLRIMPGLVLAGIQAALNLSPDRSPHLT